MKDKKEDKNKDLPIRLLYLGFALALAGYNAGMQAQKAIDELGKPIFFIRDLKEYKRKKP